MLNVKSASLGYLSGVMIDGQDCGEEIQLLMLHGLYTIVRHDPITRSRSLTRGFDPTGTKN